MTTQTAPQRTQTVPDFSTVYRDTGCSLHSACLTCPFPDCVIDEPGYVQKLHMERRYAAIRADLAAGMTAAEVAVKYGVHRRTIDRAKRGQR